MYSQVSLIKSLINSVWYAGQVAGALTSPYVCDNWGRKREHLINTFEMFFSDMVKAWLSNAETLRKQSLYQALDLYVMFEDGKNYFDGLSQVLAAYIISVVVMTAACGMQMIASFTPFPEILIAGRIITAIFSPLSDAALILYLQEISPSSLRGTMSSLYSTGYAVMCLFGMLLGHEDVLGHSLSVLLFVPVIPGIIATVAIVLMPETPKFLMISRQNTKAAMRSLKFYQGDREGLQDELVNLQLESNDNKVKEEPEGGVKTVLTTRHLRSAFASSVAVLVLTLPFYPILQNSTYFFTHLQVPNNTAQLSSSIMMVLLTCSCVTSTCIVDKLPRRKMLLAAGSLCVISLSIFVIAAELGFKYVAMAAVFAFISSY
ncbi:Transporter major facilitator family protein, partial [Trichostrongylus colubriformis]